MPRPTQLERAMLRYQGMPAAAVANAEGITVERVLEVQRRMRERGMLPPLPSTKLEAEQLELDVDPVDLMRSNAPPVGL